MRRFYAAAADGDGIGGSKLKPGRCLPQAVVEGEHGRFFDGDAARARAAIRQGGCGDFCGAFIFLPSVDFGREAQLLAEPAFFKGGAHEQRLTFCGNEQPEQPLARPPTDACEVVK